MTTRRYPIGIQTFSEIRTKDMLYIDKTELIYKMVSTNAKFFFLSCPRRFGKSLLVSTLHSYFEGKKELFEGLAIARLTRQYDGYHFAWPSPDIFNPFSLLNCFSDRKLDAYWFGSGTPTYLIEMMRKFNVIPSDVGEVMETMQSAFDAPTEHMIDITPLLYQSGYVTIKDYDRDTQLYTLAIPNGEIRTGLFESLLPNYLGRVNTKGGVAIAKMSLKIRRGDMVIETQDHIYVMELKFEHSAAEALAQIERSQYAQAYAMKGKPVTLVGIGFSVKEERNITEWVTKAH